MAETAVQAGSARVERREVGRNSWRFMGGLRRVGRWWLTHWLRYAEVVGAQWR